MTPWWKSAAAEFLPGWLKARRTPKPGPTIVRDAAVDPAPASATPSPAASEHRPATGVDPATPQARSEG